MVKNTQTTNRQELTNCLSVFGHFLGLAFKGLTGLRLDILPIVPTYCFLNSFNLYSRVIYDRKV